MPKASRLRRERAQDLNQIGEIARPRRLETQFCLARGMKKAEDTGVQSLPGKDDGGVISEFLRGCFGARRLTAASIGGIADQGMADMGEMHANLMGASGFQTALDKGREGLFLVLSGGGERLQHAVAGACGL